MELDDYSKDVLVAYIKRYVLWRKKDLDRVKHDLEFEKLMKESEEIRKKMDSKKDIGQIHEYIKLMEKDAAVHKKIDKLLGLGDKNAI